jgi:hypothetical protein
VTLNDIMDARSVQGGLFDDIDPDRASRLMGVMDELSDQFGERGAAGM